MAILQSTVRITLLFVCLALAPIAVSAQPANGMQPYLDPTWNAQTQQWDYKARMTTENGRVYVAASGWAVYNAKQLVTAPHLAAYVDDWYVVGWGPAMASRREDVCPLIVSWWGWSCRAGRSLWMWGAMEDWWGVVPSNESPAPMVGVNVRRIDVTHLTPGTKHYLRLVMWDITPCGGCEPPSTWSNTLEFTR